MEPYQDHRQGASRAVCASFIGSSGPVDRLQQLCKVCPQQRRRFAPAIYMQREPSDYKIAIVNRRGSLCVRGEATTRNILAVALVLLRTRQQRALRAFVSIRFD
jgi:hypothetical protein